MRQNTIWLGLILEHPRLGALDRGLKFCVRIVVNVRLLGTIVTALFVLANLSYLNLEQEGARPRIVRGTPGVQIVSFALSPTGKKMATTNTAGQVALRTLDDGWQIERLLEFPGFAKAVAFSPDGESIAVVGYAPIICLWDLSRQSATAIAFPVQKATRVIFSPDGKSLAVASQLDGTVFLCDLVTRRQRMVLHHPSPVVTIAFSPDGGWLATTMKDDWSILLWDLSTGSRHVLQKDGPGPVSSLAFSPDGTALASARLWENHVRLWDLGTREERRVFVGHARPVNSIAFSPDGSLLATAANDGTLGLWIVATGRRRLSLNAVAICPRTVEFYPDGRTLVLATNNDDDVRLWDIGELLRIPPRSAFLPENNEQVTILPPPQSPIPVNSFHGSTDSPPPADSPSNYSVHFSASEILTHEAEHEGTPLW
jgi:WD40 repeat protein